MCINLISPNVLYKNIQKLRKWYLNKHWRVSDTSLVWSTDRAHYWVWHWQSRGTTSSVFLSVRLLLVHIWCVWKHPMKSPYSDRPILSCKCVCLKMPRAVIFATLWAKYKANYRKLGSSGKGKVEKILRQFSEYSSAYWVALPSSRCSRGGCLEFSIICFVKVFCDKRANKS